MAKFPELSVAIHGGEQQQDATPANKAHQPARRRKAHLLAGSQLVGQARPAWTRCVGTLCLTASSCSPSLGGRVPPRLTEPVPLEALRDLIGICRALYAAWKTEGVGPVELDDLLQIGKDLKEAHRLARNTPPNTIGHRAAWSRAEGAVERLGHLVGALEQLRPVIRAASGRVLGSKRHD